MSGSVNKVILIGNLGADPEVKSLSSGQKVVNLRVATSDNWTDKNTGEKRERPMCVLPLTEIPGMRVLQRFLNESVAAVSDAGAENLTAIAATA